MDFWYTARGTYDKHYDQEGISWKKYLDWSKLSNLREVISLDTMLNEILVKSDHNYTDDWNHIITQNPYERMLYLFGLCNQKSSASAEVSIGLTLLRQHRLYFLSFLRAIIYKICLGYGIWSSQVACILKSLYCLFCQCF